MQHSLCQRRALASAAAAACAPIGRSLTLPLGGEKEAEEGREDAAVRCLTELGERHQRDHGLLLHMKRAS